MTEPRYTPGPWRPADAFAEGGFTMNDGSVPIMAGTEEDASWVALVVLRVKAKKGQAYKATDAERDANIALITASPDMHGALTRTQALLNAAMAAVPVGGDLFQSLQVAYADNRAALLKAKGGNHVAS